MAPRWTSLVTAPRTAIGATMTGQPCNISLFFVALQGENIERLLEATATTPMLSDNRCAVMIMGIGVYMQVTVGGLFCGHTVQCYH